MTKSTKSISPLRQRMLDDMAVFGLAEDYVAQREKITQNMTAEEHQALAAKYLPDAMVYLVVGDAETQLQPLAALGLGDPVLLDKNGSPVQPAAAAGTGTSSGN